MSAAFVSVPLLDLSCLLMPLYVICVLDTREVSGRRTYSLEMNERWNKGRLIQIKTQKVETQDRKT
jgi:hypothetical protein